MSSKKLLISLAALVLLTGCLGSLSQTEAEAAAANFINSVLLSDTDVEAEILDIQKEAGLWRLQVQLQDREVTSFLSRDGSVFFPQAMDVLETTKASEEKKAAEVAAQADIDKSAKPLVELFVMSHCPFGTQAEKGIIPAIEALGDKVDFQLKFVYYAMHGKEEVDEQIRQYAIQKNYPDKFLPYLKEFLKDGKSGDALKAAEIDVMELAGHISAADEEFAATQNLEDETSYVNGNPQFNTHKADNDKYGVGGSPTLIVNGKVIEGASRAPSGMLETICNAFVQAPEECSTELSAATPSAGFGYAEGEGDGGECS
ncbi:MAG: hypothetical protein ABIH35_02265 [Patescibacteria group bacterium]